MVFPCNIDMASIFYNYGCNVAKPEPPPPLSLQLVAKPKPPPPPKLQRTLYMAPKWHVYCAVITIEKVKIRIWIWIEIGRKGSRSFGPILRAVQIQIKILKKDLDPGFSDPLVRSSNSLAPS